MLNAYGSSLTRSVCCVTPVLRGHPSRAAWLSSSHQSWWKAGRWPSTMTDWRGARNSSPWIEAYRPGAGGWQGPAMRTWWIGSGTGLVMCACVCVCVCVSKPAEWLSSPVELTEGTQGEVVIGHSVRQKERMSSRSYTQKTSSLGSLRLSGPRPHPPTSPYLHSPRSMSTYQTTAHLVIRELLRRIHPGEMENMIHYWHGEQRCAFESRELLHFDLNS